MNPTELFLLTVIAVGALVVLYTYLGYPLLLWLLGRLRPGREAPVSGGDEGWPFVSISCPAYNEEAQMEGLIRSLLALDYPRDKLQILIISDASSDGTDEIVRGFQDQGIELLRMPERGGKTRAENHGAEYLRGEIVVNTDCSIRIAPHALKPLISALSDPRVGLASGRDISVGSHEEHGNTGESGYVGYEMKIRDLETRVSGIVGASGCFYAIRAPLHRIPLPDALSRDFAAALHTRENGFRAVSVPEAICFVPRTASLRREYRRKVRTMSRGMDTLRYKRSLLNPVRYGAFSWMLASHKGARWLSPWFAGAAFLAMLGLAAAGNRIALGFSVVGLLLAGLALIGLAMGHSARIPRIFSIPAYLVSGNLAACHALIRHLKGDRDATWEPTRRDVATPA